MNKCLLSALLVSLVSGCSLMGPQAMTDGNEIAKATSATDAVEGDQGDSDGLLGLLRRRDDAMPGDPSWTPILPTKKAEPFAGGTGSLFSLVHTQDLYNGTKPREIGDIVTVMLEEKTQAKKSANNDTTKSNDLSLDPIEVGGQQVKLGEATLSYTVKNDNKTTGSTNADQSNSISGSISVQVIDVMTNGNLMIRGEKWLTLNTGDEYIRLSGMIRPQDISEENTIASTRISNARIQYSGTGERQDVQEESWLARFFNVVL